ncbi:hypothetical protein H0H93_006515, partial [Arthromyces matolae]
IGISKLTDRGKLTMKKAFLKAFGDVPYGKSSVYKYIKVYESLEVDLKRRFIAYGQTKKGLFDNLLQEANKDSSESESDSSNTSRSRSFSRSSSRNQPRLHSPHLRGRSLTRRQSHDSRSRHSSVSSQHQLHLSHLKGRSLTQCQSQGSRSRSPPQASSSSLPNPAAVEPPSPNLCEFCDQEMPSTSSPTLIAMREALEEKSWPDSTVSDNPKHREANSFLVYADYCSRHKFEQQHLPKAKQCGWPREINFENLRERILEHHEDILHVLEKPLESEFFKLAEAGHLSKSAGKRIASWDRFLKQSAGYYGAVGYQIIIIVLQSLFPETSFDTRQGLAPLAWKDIIYEFLLPETAVLLIQDDLGLSRDNAIETLHASRSYGNTMFPVEDENPIIDRLQQASVAAHQATTYIRPRPTPRHAVPDPSISTPVIANPLGNLTPALHNVQIKVEEVHHRLHNQGSSHDVIDLTLSDTD